MGMKRRYGKREHLVCGCRDELVGEEGYAIPELIGKEIVMSVTKQEPRIIKLNSCHTASTSKIKLINTDTALD
ncbi:hypothetical protein MTP99_007609 [Tenebrio molitor]|nr:hypothetical protein MTP99_007609 [Tenebrio molitor]